MSMKASTCILHSAQTSIDPTGPQFQVSLMELI